MHINLGELPKLDLNAAPPTRGWKVYFLINHRMIVYVGCTIQIFKRVLDHKRSQRVFEEVRYVECKRKWEAEALERGLIAFLNPILNVNWTDKKKKAYGRRLTSNVKPAAAELGAI